MKIVWHKHNLMISSSVGSGQYSWGISYEYLLGWENLLGKIISIKRNHYFNLFFFFFSNSDFPYRICCDFFRTTLFLEKLLCHTLSAWLRRRHNSYIFGAAVFSEKLLFSSFSEQSIFRSSYFIRIASFSEQKFYRAVTSWE